MQPGRYFAPLLCAPSFKIENILAIFASGFTFVVGAHWVLSVGCGGSAVPIDILPPTSPSSRMRRRFPLVIVVWSLLGAMRISVMAVDPAEDPNALHTFTSTTGQSVKARIVNAAADSVTLAGEDNRPFTVKLAILSAPDQTFIKRWITLKTTPGAAANANVTADAINQAIGVPLFTDSSLWEEKPEAVAARLKWPKESETKFTISFRSYPNNSYRFLGARSYSNALYGEDGRTTSLSLVFANKGDLFGKEKTGGEKIATDREHMSTLDDAMEADVKAISDALTKALGAPKPQRYGDGVGRSKVLRWDWKGHAFLLQDIDREYVALEVEEAAFADAGGKMARVPQTTLRDRAKANVERRENGDVVVTNVPMVDQGPKGYCVPATCERVMRYVGLPADMYILAMAGKSGLGGGTNFETLFNGMKPEMASKSRNLTSWRGSMVMQSLAQHIDDGFPVIWGMYTTPAFNEEVWARTKERKSITDWAAWKSKMHEVARTSKLTAETNYGHGTLIIGYNKTTGEIAISDSWGMRAAERWVTLAEAEQVSQKCFFVIGL